MEVERGDQTVSAVDEAKNSIRLDVPGYSDGGNPPCVAAALAEADTGPPEPTATVRGVVESIGFRSVFVKVIETETDWRASFSSGQESLSLPEGQYLLRIDGNVRTFVRFSGTGRLRQIDTNRKRLEFAEPTAVSVGFESRIEYPKHTVTVERSVAGAARAVSLCSATTINTSPDRTWPTQRNLPPLVEFGETTQVPDAVGRLQPETNVRLVVPDDLRYVFVVAPLAQYLGATVEAEPDASPRLSLAGYTVELPELPTLQDRVGALLQRVFYLDCVARGAGPHGGELSVSDVLDDLALDAERLYETPMAERVQAYLDADFQSVRHRFPTWHLAMYVQPSLEYVPTLPHLLDKLPLVRLPQSDDMTKKEWLDQSFEGGFKNSPNDILERGGATRVSREISNVELVEPELTEAMSHGWMADDVPIDVFKTFPEAYENRFKYLDRDESELQVTAIVNERDLPLVLSEEDDLEMQTEHETALAHYRQRAEELPMDIAVYENVTCSELARIFESNNDFVHYIGHRDESGLECSNGYFDISTISESNTQTFFINACGSYPVGRELVRKGSVAGGITYEQVADSSAAKVGTTFARLVMGGFSIDRGLRTASRQLMTPTDYAVVGDGTHVVTQSDALVPPSVWLFEKNGEYRLIKQDKGPNMPGMRVRGHHDEDYYLSGVGREYVLSEAELLEYLEYQDSPIIFNNGIYWSDEIIEKL